MLFYHVVKESYVALLSQFEMTSRSRTFVLTIYHFYGIFTLLKSTIMYEHKKKMSNTFLNTIDVFKHFFGNSGLRNEMSVTYQNIFLFHDHKTA